MRTIMNLEVADATRVDAAFAIGRLFGPDVKIETKTVSYPDPQGTLVEVQTMIVDGQLPGDCYAKGVAYTLSEMFKQDCVAMFLPETDRGYLVGPNAREWGDFNPEFFVMPEGAKQSPILLLN